MSQNNSTFASESQREVTIMRTNPDIIESPVYDASRAGGNKEYLTADELMQRLEPHIRSLFR